MTTYSDAALPEAPGIAASEWGQALLSLLCGFVYTAFSVLLCIQGNPMSLALIPLGAALLVVAWPAGFMAVLLVSTVFQNLFLAMFVQGVDTPTEFQSAQAVNFLILGVGGAAGLVSAYQSKSGAAWRLLWPFVVFVGLAVLFTLLGVVRADPASALAYLRLFTIPGLGLACGLYLAPRVSPTLPGKLFVILAVVMLAWTYFEATWPKDLYEALNYGQFFGWKKPGYPMLADPEYLFAASVRSWLNLTGQFGLELKLPRLLGPNIHPISFAYTLAILILALAYRGRWVLALLLAPVLLMVGAKGPLVFAVLPLMVYGACRMFKTKAPLKAVPVLLAAYIALVIVYGLRSRDMHVLGLLAGLRALFVDPFGHGLGFGGNLSSMTRAGIFYQQYQAHGPPFGLESAIGVLFTQMGAFCAPLALMFTRVGKRVSAMVEASPRAMILLVAMAMLLANALFQEEAFSPVSAGLAMLLLGLNVSTVELATQRGRLRA